MVRVLGSALVGALLLVAPAHARERAPGAPGQKADWASADKQGFGTSATKASRVWFTLRKAELTEVYYPDLSHPSARDARVHGRRAHASRPARCTQDTLAYTQTSSTSSAGG